MRGFKPGEKIVEWTVAQQSIPPEFAKPKLAHLFLKISASDWVITKCKLVYHPDDTFPADESIHLCPLCEDPDRELIHNG